MSHLLISIAVHAYALAALGYLACLVRQARALVTGARVLTGFGLGMHGVGLFQLFAAQGGGPVGMAQGFSFLAFLLLALFLFLDLRYRRPVFGAFLMPLSVAALLPAVLMHGADSVLPAEVRQPLLWVHISIALLGLAAFGIAAGVAVMYLVMEREVKSKHFGLLFTRLPSLEFLDTLNRRLVIWGFIALSITLATGGLFSSAEGPAWTWEPKQVATVVGWCFFGGLVSARVFAGWQGKRTAFLTMAGFGIVLVSFLSSYDLGPTVGVR